MTFELERSMGRIEAKLDAMNEDIREVAKLIPVVAVHEEKHNDIEENIKPKVEEHEKKFNWVIGAAAVLGVLGSGIFKLVEAFGGWFIGDKGGVP